MPISLLTILASLSALAAWRSNAQLRRRNRYIDELHARETFVLHTVGALVASTRVSSEAVLATLAQAVRRHDPSIDAIAIFVPTGEELVCAYLDGARVEHCRSVRLRRDDRRYLPARAALDGHRAIGPDGMLLPTDRSALAAPLLDGNGLRAVLYASSSSSAALRSEEAIVQAVEHATSPFALALEREADRADATYDGLTGLLLPRAFRDRLREDAARARTNGRSVISLWFIDTDHFKSVNDTYGHAAGDAVLQAMANLLRAHAVPGVDVVGRNGGDEFCAIVHDAQKTVAIERAQELCDAVRSHDFGIPLRITASIGVATLPYDARDPSELLEVADAAMYHSKRSGRDRVSFAVNGTAFSIYRAAS